MSVEQATNAISADQERAAQAMSAAIEAALPPLLKQKVIKFKAMMALLPDSIVKTPIGMIRDASVVQIVGFLYMMYIQLSANGTLPVGRQEVERCVEDNCQEYAQCRGRDVLSEEQYNKLADYLCYFSEVMARKHAASRT